MKKRLQKFGAIISAMIFVLSLLPGMRVLAADEEESEYTFFIAFSGSGEAAGEGGLNYFGPGNEANTEGIVAVNATAKVGDTVVISLEFPEAVTGTLIAAPMICTEDDLTVFSDVAATVSLKVNDEDVEIDHAPEAVTAVHAPVGDLYHAWRLYGGADIAGNADVPVNAFDGAKKIEYTITLDDVTEEMKVGPSYEGEALVFVGFSADHSDGEGAAYLGPENENNSEGLTAVYKNAAVGDTVTVSLVLPNAIRHLEWVSPVIVPGADCGGFAEVDATVTLKIDGIATDIDTAAGDAAWSEITGDYEDSWRLYGGVTNGGIEYVNPGLFAGATRIEYTVTLDHIYEVEPEPEPEPEIIIPEEEVPDEPVTEPVQPVVEVTPEENAIDPGLVKGIVIAVLAVICIILGIVLSKERPVDPDDKKANKDSEKKSKDDPDDDDDTKSDDAEDETDVDEDESDEDDENVSESESDSPESDPQDKDNSAKTEKKKEEKEIEDELKRIDSVIAEGPYLPEWASLSKVSVPEWFKESRFGIFIHWGVFTSEEFANEWYPRGMYIKDSPEYKHHVEKYGPHSKTGYKDYVERFKGENFDPDEWISLFKRSGAKYVIPVGEHHDGFQMYGSRISHWNAAEMGPHRDIVSDLKKSAEKYGIHFGVSSHRFEHWWFLGNGRNFDSDIKGEFKRGDLYWPSCPEPADQHDFDVTPAPSEEFMQDWLVRVCEIVDLFKPEVIYFDWWIAQKVLKPYLKKAAAYYYNVMAKEGKEGIIISKNDAFAPGASVRDIERGGLSGAAAYIWQSDTPIAHGSWGYVPGMSYKTALDIVRELIDIVSKNGNLLLNVGPKADGLICDEEKEVLEGVGKWLEANGEMIYGTTPYKVFGEGSVNREEGGFKDSGSLEYTSEDFRFTEGAGCIYAAAMSPSADSHYLVKSFAKNGEDGSASYKGLIERVTLLSGGKVISWEHTDKGLEIVTEEGNDPMPVVFKIELM